MSQASWNYASGKTTRKVSAPPGGQSSVVFGSAEVKETAAEPEVTQSIQITEPVVAEDSKAVEAVMDAGPSLEALKLQAIAAIASACASDTVKDAITDLIKALQVAAADAPSSEATGVHSDVAEATGSGFAELAAFKAALKLRGTHGIFSIGKRFKSMDDDGDRKLSYDEFKKAVQESKLGLNEGSMTKLFRHFDVDSNGYLSYDEFLVGLRGELNERRKDMVGRAFQVLDKTGDGRITLADLEGRYDASKHPDVVAGIKTDKEVVTEFMEVFESQGNGEAKDGVVSLEEFSKYYSMISASVDGDDYFELMMRNVWHISGGEGWCENTTCKRLLVVHNDGTEVVKELTDDFDVDVKDLAAVKAQLMAQGVKDIKSIALYGDMTSSTSAPGSDKPHTPPASPAAGLSGTSVVRRGGKSDKHQSSIVFG